MPDSMRYRLTDERSRLMDQLRGKIDDLPDQRWKADVVDMALQNLKETIDNHQEYDGDPRLAKHFGTSVVRPHYRTHVSIERVD